MDKLLINYVNALFDKEEKRLEDKAKIFTVLTNVTLEQEKQGWELVDKIKELRERRVEFNEEAIS